MATLGLNGLSIVDLAKRTGPDGKIQRIAEILNKSTPFSTVVWKQGNRDIGNQYTVRTSLPAGSGEKLANGSVLLENTTTGQGVDAAYSFERVSSIEEKTWDLQEDKAELVMSESIPFIQKMREDFMNALINGTKDTTFEGLKAKYNTSTNMRTVIKAGGSTANVQTSIYFVNWRPDVCYAFSPKAIPAGLRIGETKEEATFTTVSGKTYRKVLRNTPFKLDAGLTIENHLYAGRIANIEHSTLSATGTNLREKIIELLSNVESVEDGAPVLYVGRKIYTFLRLQLDAKTNLNLSMEEVANGTPGRKVLTFDGVPVMLNDHISLTEGVVS